ncbi:hypothetical protein [Haloferula rosea]|uniref:Yip1 domain-containing protein n=1 Tax=Haloferula rosea TaxID=490093 RepID=A0A934VEK3_9BACT|nr:hypothetical protein [Haloferula rosea]MBK1826126.1 hypothetical protein [Haloferula rosea]
MTDPTSTPPALPETDHPTSLPDALSLRDFFEALLRRPTDLARHEGGNGAAALRNFGIIAATSMFVFGLVLGTFAYHEQLWAAPLKLGGGLIFAGLICFPSFYIFSCLSGSDASANHLAATLGGMLALAGLLLLGFAPAVWIFTQGTLSFGFMGALAIGSWLIALFFGFRFVITSLKAHGARQTGPILIWCTIFLLVSLQLTTSLRPILGRSERFLTDEKKFFLQHWAESMDQLLPNPDDNTETANSKSW